MKELQLLKSFTTRAKLFSTCNHSLKKFCESCEMSSLFGG